MNPCDLVITGGDVLDLDAPGSTLTDHAVVVIRDHVARGSPGLGRPFPCTAARPGITRVTGREWALAARPSFWLAVVAW